MSEQEPSVHEASLHEPSEDQGHFASLVGRPIKHVSPIPEKAQPHQGHRAGLVTRFTADAIDFVIVGVLLAVGYVAYATILFLVDARTFSFPTVPFGKLLLIYGAVLVAYLTVGWWLTGRTYGKHLMGLRVVNYQGEPMRFLGSLARASFCVVFPIGLFWVLVSPANRSIQDVVIRSSVIYNWSVRRGRP